MRKAINKAVLGEDQVFNFSHIKFEISLYMQVEMSNKYLGILVYSSRENINMKIVFKAIRLDELPKGVNLDREEKRITEFQH